MTSTRRDFHPWAESPTMERFEVTGPSRDKPVTLTFGTSTWEAELLAKVRDLRANRKRVILVIDGSVIFLYRAENAGTIRME